MVVGAEWGHGKRNSVLSDYTFAVRDENTGELKTIGKAYSGLTDEEILELTAHFQQNILATRGKYHEVRPDVVLEIAFDSIQPSTRHTSGLSMRFPRIKALRRDKNAVGDRHGRVRAHAVYAVERRSLIFAQLSRASRVYPGRGDLPPSRRRPKVVHPDGATS